MPATRSDILNLLTTLNIESETVDHPPIFTVEEGRNLKKSMPGGHSKNLFVKDKKSVLYLAVAWSDTKVDLVGLGKDLGAKGRLSFGKPELMSDTLGVIPGAVTPFTLINESAKALASVIVDSALMDFDRVWFHPLENTASTSLAPSDLLKFMHHCGFEPKIMDLSAPLAPNK